MTEINLLAGYNEQSLMAFMTALFVVLSVVSAPILLRKQSARSYVPVFAVMASIVVLCGAYFILTSGGRVDLLVEAFQKLAAFTDIAIVSMIIFGTVFITGWCSLYISEFLVDEFTEKPFPEFFRGDKISWTVDIYSALSGAAISSFSSFAAAPFFAGTGAINFGIVVPFAILFCFMIAVRFIEESRKYNSDMPDGSEENPAR